jgi:hypothetical protein
VPTGPAWRRLIVWILGFKDRLPVNVIPDAAELYTNYARSGLLRTSPATAASCRGVRRGFGPAGHAIAEPGDSFGVVAENPVVQGLPVHATELAGREDFEGPKKGCSRALKSREKRGGFRRLGCGGEDRLFVGLQNGKPRNKILRSARGSSVWRAGRSGDQTASRSSAVLVLFALI